MTEMPTKIRVFLIEDQTMVRAALRSLLERTSHFVVVGDAGDARTGIAMLPALQPDIVVLDITMPGLSGLDAVGPIKKACPRTRVLMASQHEGYQFVRDALQAGADGYLSKDSDPDELRVAIESCLRGESYLSPKVSAALVRSVRDAEPTVVVRGPLEALTPREREVLQSVAVGRSNKEIATTLGVSLGTVKKHRENLQRKLDCHSPAELARLAIREGLLRL